MNGTNPSLSITSYILQLLGFIGIFLSWVKALHELRRGERYYSTRLLLFIITSIAFVSYIVPTLLTVCYFMPGCFQPAYRDYMRLFSGIILFLYGLFTFLLYYTKDGDRRKPI